VQRAFYAAFKNLDWAALQQLLELTASRGGNP
jgi:hypothetical protein